MGALIQLNGAWIRATTHTLADKEIRATIHTLVDKKKNRCIWHIQATYTHNLLTSHFSLLTSYFSSSAMGGRGGG